MAIATVVSSALAYSLVRIAILVATSRAPTPPRVTTEVLRTLTSFLTREQSILVGVGVAALVALWLTSDSARAASLRPRVTAIWRGAERTVRSHASEVLPQHRVDRRQQRELVRVADTVGGTAAIVILVVAVRTISSLEVLTIAVAIGVGVSLALHRTLSDEVEPDSTDTQSELPTAPRPR